MKILIVDDSKAVHAYVKEALKDMGPQIDDAFNGKEACEKLEHGSSYDLILLDWEMPVMTGPETLEHIKRMGIVTPVFMMTSKNAVEDIRQMISNGAKEYIMKPFTQDILVDKINSFFGTAA